MPSKRSFFQDTLAHLLNYLVLFKLKIFKKVLKILVLTLETGNFGTLCFPMYPINGGHLKSLSPFLGLWMIINLMRMATAVGDQLLFLVRHCHSTTTFPEIKPSLILSYVHKNPNVVKGVSVLVRGLFCVETKLGNVRDFFN